MTVFQYSDNQSKPQVYKEYNIALGFSPVGKKKKAWDGKTPEGEYKICSKNDKSQYHLSLKLSYPSDNDRKKAKKKKRDPGGNICIHGLGPQFRHFGANHVQRNWTLGCIAVTDQEIEELSKVVSVGTKVCILP